MDKVRYVTVNQFAAKHSRTSQRVRQVLGENRIPGAVRVMVRGRAVWAIPENAPWPELPGFDEIDLTPLVEEKLARKKPGPKPKG